MARGVCYNTSAAAASDCSIVIVTVSLLKDNELFPLRHRHRTKIFQNCKHSYHGN